MSSEKPDEELSALSHPLTESNLGQKINRVEAMQKIVIEIVRSRVAEAYDTTVSSRSKLFGRSRKPSKEIHCPFE